MVIRTSSALVEARQGACTAWRPEVCSAAAAHFKCRLLHFLYSSAHLKSREVAKLSLVSKVPVLQPALSPAFSAAAWSTTDGGFSVTFRRFGQQRRQTRSMATECCSEGRSRGNGALLRADSRGRCTSLNWQPAPLRISFRNALIPSAWGPLRGFALGVRMLGSDLPATN